MRYFATIFSVLFFNLLAGQSTKITEIKRGAEHYLREPAQASITYPLIIANTTLVTEKINNEIGAYFLSDNCSSNSTETCLDSMIANGLAAMSYEVTYNKNNILSLTIHAESCGAYCSNWSACFNFNLLNGNTIKLEEIIKPERLGIFKNTLVKKKNKMLATHKQELEAHLKDKKMDQETFDWVSKELIPECVNTISLEKFQLFENKLVVNDACEFPHVIRCYEPFYELTYNYNSISELINTKWKALLMK